MADSASFADFVKDARERKKNEVLAQQFLGSRRKANASGAGSVNARANPPKPTLLSRMSGVQKSRSTSTTPVPAANINGKWQHDLHKLNNPSGPPKRLNRTVSASQIDNNTRTFDKFAAALSRNAQNANRNNEPETAQFSIKGVAAPSRFTIVACNFAPGTTAADIEAVIGPHGGETLGCRVVVSSPTVMAELTFASKEGADNVIATFNNKKADGRLLYVYEKTTPSSAPSTAPLHSRPTRRGGKASDDMDIDTNGGARVSNFQDGRLGFENGRREPPRGPRRRY